MHRPVGVSVLIPIVEHIALANLVTTRPVMRAVGATASDNRLRHWAKYIFVRISTDYLSAHRDDPFSNALSCFDM
jgi:hypothetical protein